MRKECFFACPCVLVIVFLCCVFKRGNLLYKAISTLGKERSKRGFKLRIKRAFGFLAPCVCALDERIKTERKELRELFLQRREV